MSSAATPPTTPPAMAPTLVPSPPPPTPPPKPAPALGTPPEVTVLVMPSVTVTLTEGKHVSKQPMDAEAGCGRLT